MKAFGHAIRRPWFWAGLLILSLAATACWWFFRCPWDYDPKKLLNDSRLNKEFVTQARSSLRAASRAGLRPKVIQTYRSSAESDSLNKKYLAGGGSRAAAGWQSCHNYGLAFDIMMIDEEGKLLDNRRKGWYQFYEDFAKIAEKRNLLWGDAFTGGDAGHFEYHPAWHSGANGNFLINVRKWALKAAGEKGRANAVTTNQPPPKWLEHVWWAAGAKGQPPAGAFLANNPVPVEPVRVAVIYAHEDDALRFQFSPTLKRLQRDGVIISWVERKLMPGDVWDGVIDKSVQRADFFLLLASTNLLASDYCSKNEMQMIMTRRQSGQARVLPVILSQCEWKKTPYGTLQALPKTGKTVIEYPKLKDAWAEVARDFRSELRAYRGYK